MATSVRRHGLRRCLSFVWHDVFPIVLTLSGLALGVAFIAEHVGRGPVAAPVNEPNGDVVTVADAKFDIYGAVPDASGTIAMASDITNPRQGEGGFDIDNWRVIEDHGIPGNVKLSPPPPPESEPSSEDVALSHEGNGYQNCADRLLDSLHDYHPCDDTVTVLDEVFTFHDAVFAFVDRPPPLDPANVTAPADAFPRPIPSGTVWSDDYWDVFGPALDPTLQVQFDPRIFIDCDLNAPILEASKDDANIYPLDESEPEPKPGPEPEPESTTSTFQDTIQIGDEFFAYPSMRRVGRDEIDDEGRRHGRIFRWHPDGITVQSRTQWVRGKRHGLAQEWYDNGSPESVTVWVDGARRGLAERFARSDDGRQGRVILRETYDDDGNLDGARDAWNPDTGKMVSHQVWIHGTLQYNEEFNAQGARLREESYLENGETYFIRSFHPNGRVHRLRQGDQESAVTWQWDANGKELPKTCRAP